MTDIFVIGYPKVGGSWLCRLLGDILNSPVGCAYRPDTDKEVAAEGQDRKGDYYIGHGHMMPSKEGDVLVPNHKVINLNCLKDEKIIVMFRDPRDVVVSANHHWGIGDIHKTIEIMAKGDWPIPHGGGLKPFYETWLKLIVETWLKLIVEDGIETVLYEWLRNDTPRSLEHALANLGIDTASCITTDAVERQSFNNRCKWTKEHGHTLNYGKDYQLRFLRKGIVGDWKNHFDEKAIDMCEEYWGDLMREMGYAT